MTRGRSIVVAGALTGALTALQMSGLSAQSAPRPPQPQVAKVVVKLQSQSTNGSWNLVDSQTVTIDE